MSEQTFTYRNNELNLDEAYYYALLVKVEGNTFSYAITYKNKLMAYEDSCPLSELTNPLQLQDLLDARYKKTVIGLPATGFSLIPTAMFNPDHLSELAHLLDVKETEKVLAQVLDENNYIVYKVDSKLLEGLSKYDYRNITFGGKGLIKALSKNNPTNDQLFINIETNKVELVYFRDHKVRFYNSFEYSNASDVAYYAVMVAKELELQPSNIELIISGKTTEDDDIQIALSGFFANMMQNVIHPLDIPEQLSAHQLLSLTSLSLCELSEAL
ncbi:MAG: DUF3822 family protein [Mucilaginibacter sp.]